MTVSRRIVWLIGALAFLIPTTVYLLTMQRSVPFWDSGEFIAVSYILGIPHPPGTPFYVLLGRIATLLPIGSIAERVNGMSAVASGLAVMVTFLTILRLIRLTQGTNARPRTKCWRWPVRSAARCCSRSRTCTGRTARRPRSTRS
jgi:hypothetical protein